MLYIYLTNYFKILNLVLYLNKKINIILLIKDKMKL